MMQCFWCGEVKAVALLGKLPDDRQAPRSAVYDYEPCDKCIELRKQGITIIAVDPKTRRPTGAHVIIKSKALATFVTNDETIKRILKEGGALIDADQFEDIFKEAIDELSKNSKPD